jgi:BirA family biotin operon repressor/biotin-[acetyl-CoA-carboxylase] ligase
MKTLDCPNPFGAPVYHEETVSSTMDLARLLARRGEPHGTVIAADYQEAGRGRTGRSWKMDKGQNLSFTILLRCPALPPALTLKAGLALSLALEDFAPPLAGRVRVKWPNDVMLLGGNGAGTGARKAAGVLAEAEGPAVYLGIGVNLGQREFPEELRDKAGSVLGALEELRPGEGGAAPDLPARAPLRLLEKILPRLHGELEAAVPWKERLEERLFMRGEQVVFVNGAAGSGDLVEGLLCGIGGGGELLLLPRGAAEPRPFVTGELRVYGPA